MLLNNEWVHNGIMEEIKKYLETNENENTATKNLWDSVKAVPYKREIHRHRYIFTVRYLFSTDDCALYFYSIL